MTTLDRFATQRRAEVFGGSSHTVIGVTQERRGNEDEQERAHASPEEAALGGWPPEARARVVKVIADEYEAIVIVDTEPSHPMQVHCCRTPTGWIDLWDTTA